MAGEPQKELIEMDLIIDGRTFRKLYELTYGYFRRIASRLEPVGRWTEGGHLLDSGEWEEDWGRVKVMADNGNSVGYWKTREEFVRFFQNEFRGMIIDSVEY